MPVVLRLMARTLEARAGFLARNDFARIMALAFCLCVGALTLLGVDVAGGAFPGHNGRIAFVRTRNGRSQIWVVNGDGTKLRRLTHGSGDPENPAFSANGKLIAFDSDRRGNFDVYVMRADGSHMRRVTSSPADEKEPSFSPSGKRIAFTRHGDIYVVNANGSGEQQITTDREQGAFAHDPAFSPNGNEIAFSSGLNQNNRSIFLVGVDRRNRHLLTNDTPYDDNHPAFSPHGTRVAYDSHPEMEQGPNDIRVVGAAGKHKRFLPTGNSDIGEPAFSPTGHRIVAADQEGFGGILVMDVNGHHRHRITNFGSSPDWQPKAR